MRPRRIRSSVEPAMSHTISFLSDGDRGPSIDWPRIFAYMTGTVDQELRHRNAYLVAENRIPREQLRGRLLLCDSAKKTLAEIGYRLRWKAREDVANAAKLETILGWYRKPITQKVDGSMARRKAGRPSINDDIEQLIVRMARENPSSGFDRIAGALAYVGHQVSDWTVGNALRLPRRGSARPRGQRSFMRTFGTGKNQLFQCGGLHAARVGDLLCALPHPPRDPKGEHRRRHCSPR